MFLSLGLTENTTARLKNVTRDMLTKVFYTVTLTKLTYCARTGNVQFAILRTMK